MSYDNAEPKILKTLNSSGQVLDSSGEVIADTSDYWLRFYEQAEPKPDKILHSNGTITDSDDNLIQDTTPFNITKYNRAEPIPAKYLHADGTLAKILQMIIKFTLGPIRMIMLYILILSIHRQTKPLSKIQKPLLSTMVFRLLNVKIFQITNHILKTVTANLNYL